MVSLNLPQYRLAGDIGGTKTLLRLVFCGPGGPEIVQEQRFSSAAFNGLVPMISELLASAKVLPQAACFGVAGPVNGGRAKLTNLPWWIDADEITEQCSIPKVRLINDFEAIGYGIEALDAGDMVTLQAGEPQANGPRAVLGAGTGLGECFLFWQGDHYEVVASEGGHVDFAPAGELQMELLRFLSSKFGHVSYERIVSGPGLVKIHQFLLERGGVQCSPELAQALQGDDAAAAISEAAIAGTDSSAAQALDLFLGIYGAQAGNLALTVLARGGVYIAGGIAPKIIDQMKGGAFMNAFRDKGRYAEYLQSIPLHVVMNQEVGLLGAALAAARL
jgi:glucokinase